MEELSRRSVVSGACALFALGFVNLADAASASVRRLSNGRLSVQVSSIPELAQIGGAVRVGKLRGAPIGLARTGEKTYRAFSLACPHQGVTVVRTRDGWLCREHRSEFGVDGELILGPATSGLAQVPSRLSKGQVIIG